jgi:hypothetical protein
MCKDGNHVALNCVQNVSVTFASLLEKAVVGFIRRQDIPTTGASIDEFQILGRRIFDQQSLAAPHRAT